MTLQFVDSYDAVYGENSFTVASGSVTVGCDHQYGNTFTKVDEKQHQQTCTKCGEAKKSDHNWNEGVTTVKATCTVAGTKEYTCQQCGATKTETIAAKGHKYENSCGGTCTVCGEVGAEKHTFSTTWSKDDNSHWHECTGKCGTRQDEAAHIASSDGKTCTVCQAKLPQIANHEHNMETEWTYDNTSHWHRCTWKNPSCYYVEDRAAHDYDDDCDVTCNTCSAVRTAPHNYMPEWQGNAEGHWQICADCGAKSEIFEHVPGPEATEEDPQVCTECGFRIKMPTSHVHDYGETWYSDDDAHWQSCYECAEATPMEPHVWNEGATLEDGTILYTCGVCFMELTLDEPMPSEPETEPSTQPVTPGEEKDSGGFPWQWAGIAAIVLMLIGIILLVIEFIRSSKTNMHGRFSK